MEKPAITLTENAADHVRRFLDQQTGGVGLRVAVKPTGCSGYQYVVNLAKDTSESDKVIISRGINLVVDDQSYPVLKGTEMDYIKEGLTEGFRFYNPNVEQTCGCGESFSIKPGKQAQTG